MIGGRGETARLASPADGFALFAALALENRERLAVAYLDPRHVVLAVELGAPGFHCSTALPLRGVLRGAIHHGASTLLVAHNHPSGDPTPSLLDLQASRRLAEAARVLGMSLLDHLIVAPGAALSLRLMGML
jgi:DNA repair protein RadC